MLEIASNVICSIIIVLISIYTVKKVLKPNINFFTIRNSFLFTVLVAFIVIFKSNTYSMLYTLSVCVMNIIIYKIVLKESLSKVTLTICVFMILIFIGEIFDTFLYMPFIDGKDLMNNIYLQIPMNITLTIPIIILLNIKPINRMLTKFVDKVNRKQNFINIMFIILLVLMITILFHELSNRYGINYDSIVVLLTVFIFMSLFFIFLNEKSNHSKLMDEYDNLFNYIQTFEEWIETEQLNRHEYKNQLAVLKILSTEKKVKNKIDDIVKDYISIDSDTVNQLRTVPNGGLKGILYYKMTIAKNKRVKLSTDVVLPTKNILSKMSEDKMKIICKLVGIYFDNAIEATLRTKKKKVLLEIYEYNEKFNIVISNTYDKKDDISKRNEKGFSTKGKNRGNGLYFAQKLIKRNDWLEEKQELLDGYYIQKLTIKKK